MSPRHGAEHSCPLSSVARADRVGLKDAILARFHISRVNPQHSDPLPFSLVCPRQGSAPTRLRLLNRFF